MAEAVRLVPRELRRIGTDDLLAHEGDQLWRLRFAVSERLHDALVEDAALDRATLEHRPLGRLELIETGC